VIRRARRSCCLTTLLLLAVAATGGATGLSWLAGTVSGLAGGGAPDAARVLRVIDGDTLLVARSGRPERVRLLGVDTPEASSTRYGHPECGANLATSATRRWVARAGRRVDLGRDRFSRRARDRYGRLLTHVSSPAGGDLARWLVSRGLARTVSYERRPLAAHPSLLALEAKARGRREGLWSKCPRWARQHAIPFATVPAGDRARGRWVQRPPVGLPMVALLAIRGAVR